LHPVIASRELIEENRMKTKDAADQQLAELL
jgi:hypothetical protein